MRTGFLLTQGSHARRLMLAEGMGIKRAPDAAVLIAVFSAGGNILCRQMMLCIPVSLIGHHIPSPRAKATR